MRDHASIERAFAMALADPAEHPSPVLTSHSCRTPVWRFDVYRNNVYSSLIGTLRAKFPAVDRLVGEEFFAGLARSYIDREPPCTPVLLAYGGGFPPFLESCEAVADLPYLPDVARLEWLVHDAYHAADCEPVGPAALSEVAPELIGDLRFALAPSCRVLTSAYPAYAIWRTNTHDAVVEPIDAAAGGESVLVVRQELKVDVLRVPHATATFAAALSEGRRLSTAIALAAKKQPEFRLDQALAILIRHRAIAAVSTRPNRSTDSLQETDHDHPRQPS